MDYKNSGVDIEAGYKSVELMKKHVKETMRPVSYTHLLNVSLFYLKQDKRGFTTQIFPAFVFSNEGGFYMSGNRAVSYTHLAVYQRQA